MSDLEKIAEAYKQKLKQKDELKKEAEAYKQKLKQLRNVEQDVWNIDRVSREKFGIYNWLSALNELPFKEVDGKIETGSGWNIMTVAETLLNLSQIRGMELSTVFNGAVLVASPTDTVMKMVGRWDKNRIRERQNNGE